MPATSSLYDSHMHTPLCKHAVGSPLEYAETAWKRNIKGIIFTCHNPMPFPFSHQGRMQLSEFPDYIALVSEARDAWCGKVDVLLGLECDYLPGFDGMDEIIESTLAMADFHFILGSIHPQLADYQARFNNGDPIALQKGYFEHLATAAETGLFDSLAHPDLIKNITADDWDLSRLMDDIRRSLDRIAATGIAMELNTSGLNKTVSEMNPAPLILAEMRARGIPVTLGSDSHIPERVGAAFPEALSLLKNIGYSCITLFKNRSPHEVPIDQALADLNEARD